MISNALHDWPLFKLSREESLVHFVTFLRVTLKAGDLLCLPEGGVHQVESVSTSLSVNFWVNSGRGW